MMFSLYFKGKILTDARFLEKFQTEEVGIFETLRTYQGKLFLEEEHLNRLKETAQTIGRRKPLPLKRIKKEMAQALHNEEALHDLVADTDIPSGGYSES